MLGMGMDLKNLGKPAEKNRSNTDKSRGIQCERASWLRATHTGPVFDLETLNDTSEAPSCHLLRKHTISRPYLIHKKLHLPGLEMTPH